MVGDTDGDAGSHDKDAADVARVTTGWTRHSQGQFKV